MTTVSAIIPNYNYAPHVAAAVDSVLQQTHRDIEIIVVDDGSSDGSVDILRGYGSRITLLQQKNAGVSAARNRGIQAAKGEFVALLDADDRWHPDKITRQLALLRPDVGLVHCWARLIDGNGKTVGSVRTGGRGYLLDQIAQLRGTILGGGSSALLPKRVFEELGYFDPGLSTSADYDMWRRVLSRYRAEMVEAELFDYRVHAGGMHLNVDVYERDVFRALDRMFTDPISAAARPHHRRAYSQFYWTLALEHARLRRWGPAVKRAINSVALSPGPALATLGRRLRAKGGDDGLLPSDERAERS